MSSSRLRPHISGQTVAKALGWVTLTLCAGAFVAASWLVEGWTLAGHLAACAAIVLGYLFVAAIICSDI
jgi:hypothetical protein